MFLVSILRKIFKEIDMWKRVNRITGYNNGFNDGVNGKRPDLWFLTKEYEQEYKRGYEDGNKASLARLSGTLVEKLKNF